MAPALPPFCAGAPSAGAQRHWSAESFGRLYTLLRRVAAPALPPFCAGAKRGEDGGRDATQESVEAPERLRAPMPLRARRGRAGAKWGECGGHFEAPAVK